MISAVGVQQLTKCDLTSNRNLFIAGFALFMGLSVPAYFAAKASPEMLEKGETLAMYQPTVEDLMVNLPSSLSGVVRAIGTTGMGVAAILGILLDNLIPGTPRERGLVLDATGAMENQS